MNQYEQYEDSGSVPFIQPNLMDGGSMVQMTDPEAEILSLEANFRGQVMLADGTYQEKFRKRMNERGINEVVGMVRAVVNRVTFMSNVKDQVLYGIMEGFADTLVQLLMMNSEAFDVKSNAERSAIFWQCVTVAHIAILRGYEEGEKRFWKGTQADISFGRPNQSAEMPSGGLSKMSPKNWMK